VLPFDEVSFDMRNGKARFSIEITQNLLLDYLLLFPGS